MENMASARLQWEVSVSAMKDIQEHTVTPSHQVGWPASPTKTVEMELVESAILSLALANAIQAGPVLLVTKWVQCATRLQ